MNSKLKILALTYLVLFFWQFVLADTVYYLVGSSGHDSNTGTSKDTPWRSPARIKDIEFKPGDKMLLKVGTRVVDQLHPKELLPLRWFAGG